MFWQITLVVVEIIVLMALIALAVIWVGMPIKDVPTILGIALWTAVIAYIAIWALVYGILENLS